MTGMGDRQAGRAARDPKRADQSLWCPRCRSRFRIPDGPPRDFAALAVPHQTVSLMREAARLFDAITEQEHDERLPAVEFVDWLSRDLREVP